MKMVLRADKFVQIIFIWINLSKCMKSFKHEWKKDMATFHRELNTLYLIFIIIYFFFIYCDMQKTIQMKQVFET